MVIQWLAFGLTVVVQCGAAIWFAATMASSLKSLREMVKLITDSHDKEIASLRDWRHDFGQKEMVYDSYGERITEAERRLDQLFRIRKS